MRAAAVAPHTKREHVRVLCQEQEIADAIRDPLFDERSLKGQRLGIGNGPETTNFERPW
jgi:hypothetical protein